MIQGYYRLAFFESAITFCGDSVVMADVKPGGDIGLAEAFNLGLHLSIGAAEACNLGLDLDSQGVL